MSQELSEIGLQLLRRSIRVCITILFKTDDKEQARLLQLVNQENFNTGELKVVLKILSTQLPKQTSSDMLQMSIDD